MMCDECDDCEKAYEEIMILKRKLTLEIEANKQLRALVVIQEQHINGKKSTGLNEKEES